MKIIVKILVILTVVVLTGCIVSPDEGHPVRQVADGRISVVVTTKDGVPEDKIETVRFLVFTDVSGSAKLELNELWNVPEVLPGEGEVSKLEVVLEVSRKLDGINDKMVIALVNEPAVTKNTLDQLSGPDGLSNLELELDQFLDPGHQYLASGKTMPMTGMVRTSVVYPTEQEAKAYPVQMELWRAVARVDVYIRKHPSVDFDIGMGSVVTLGNTYGKEYFIRNRYGPYIFGKMQTVATGFVSKNWNTAAPLSIPDLTTGSNGLLLCSFLTPERTCIAPVNSDKLTLQITAKSTAGEDRSGTVTLDQLYLNNVMTTLNEIERNNIYRVVVTLVDDGMAITATVLDWTEEDLVIEF